MYYMELLMSVIMRLLLDRVEIESWWDSLAQTSLRPSGPDRLSYDDARYQFVPNHLRQRLNVLHEDHHSGKKTKKNRFSGFTARRLLARYMLSSCVCLSVSHKPVLHWNDWTNWAGFWHGGFLPPVPRCAVTKSCYLQKLGYFTLGLCPKLGTYKKITTRQVDCVVNKTGRRRRRRRSSLLTTPVRQSTRRGCSLQVG